MSLKPCSYPPGEARLRSKSLEWCALEHLHRLVLADLLDELLEAVLAKLLRNGVRSPSLSLRVCSRTARTTAKHIPQPKAVCEADALAGVRVYEGDGVGLVGAVKPAVADVVRPAVAAENPHGLAN